MTRRNKQNGQALVATTVGLVLIGGMLGLVVDLGWGYYIKKTAQAAADAAALASVQAALELSGQAGPFTCGSLPCVDAWPCPAPPPAPPADNLGTACLYSLTNGFEQGGAGGRQAVTLTSGIGTPPTRAGLTADYWVTARVSERIPQLFSAILGNFEGGAAARATAAIVDTPVIGSLILINRQNDAGPVGTGILLSAGGGAAVNGAMGILLASSSARAGDIKGSVTVTAPFTYIRGNGGVSTGGSASWTAPPQNGFGDGSYFKDPMRGKGQPPAPSGLPSFEIMNGTIAGSADEDDPTILQPGNYYAVRRTPLGEIIATGDPIRVTGHVVFSNGVGEFGDYVFFGGLHFTSTHTVATFEPGRYILAGAKGNPGTLFRFENGVTLQDATPLVGGQSVPNTDAGELFILTDSRYPGLEIPSLVQPVADLLNFGVADLQAGNNSSSVINLHGLNRNHPNLPEALKPFAPAVLWQDQRNSRVLYTADGQVDISSCGAGRTLDNPCPGAGNNAVGMHLQASPNTFLYGAIYQPRGTWLTLQGSGEVSAPLQLITGSLDVQGGPEITLIGLSDPLMRKTVALVE
jgi:hypothetical protein